MSSYADDTLFYVLNFLHSCICDKQTHTVETNISLRCIKFILIHPLFMSQVISTLPMSPQSF